MTGPYAADLVSKEQPDAFSAHLLRARHYQKVAREAGHSIVAKLAHQSIVSVERALDVLGDNAGQSASMVQYLELMQAENLILKGRAKKALKALAVKEKDLDDRHHALACYLKSIAYRKTGKPELAQDCYEKLLQAENNEELLARYEQER